MMGFVEAGYKVPYEPYPVGYPHGGYATGPNEYGKIGESQFQQLFLKMFFLPLIELNLNFWNCVWYAVVSHGSKSLHSNPRMRYC